MNLIDFLSGLVQDRDELVNYTPPPNRTSLLGNRSQTPVSVQAMQDYGDFLPVIGDITGVADLGQELSKDDPNYPLAAALGLATVVGAVPVVGDTVARGIVTGAERLADAVPSDVKYATRSLLEGEPRGVLEAFQRGGNPQSVGAAGIGDNGGPPLNEVPARASLFSPSLRAAENLKQNKGTYEQMRGMLLKGGGKETELEWSGMDRAFAGQKVTKDDLISYLRKYDPRLDQETVSATVNPDAPQIPAGAVARADFDFDDWFENNIMSDGPMISEETNYLVDSLAQDLHYSRDDVAYGPDLDEDQAQALADATGEDVNDLMNAEYIVETGEDSVFLTDDAYDAVMAVYGEDTVEEMVRDSLYENYEYRYNYETSDFEDQTGLEFYDDPEDFGTQGVMEEGDTRYSTYMPAGFRSYDENFYTYSDPTLQFHDDYVGGASHFGAYDPQTQYHTRVGDYQTTNTVGGKPFNARYVAEIQSDAQQRTRSQDKTPMTYEQGVDLTRNRQTLLPLKNENEIAFQAARDADSEATRALNELKMQQSESGNNKFLIAAKLKRLNRGIQSHRRNALAKGPNGTEPFPHFGNNDMPPMDDIVVDWNNVTEAELNRIYRDYMLDKVDVYHADFLETIDDDAVMSSIDIPQDLRERVTTARKNLTEAEKKKAAASEKLHKEEARLDDEFEEKHGSPTYDFAKGGPMMASQNRWVDDALRRSILDAVNDDSVDFLAFPKDEEAIGKVGGTAYPKDGTLDFYRRDVQNRLRGIVKKIDKDARIQEIGLESPMRREMEFPAYGLRITPEFRRRVKEQGLPTFAALGAIPIMGVIDYMREKQENRNQRLGGLMGYGGL